MWTCVGKSTWIHNTVWIMWVVSASVCASSEKALTIFWKKCTIFLVCFLKLLRSWLNGIISFVRSLSILSLLYLVCKKRHGHWRLMSTSDTMTALMTVGWRKQDAMDALSLSLSLRKGGFLFYVLSQHSTTITSFPGSFCLNRFPGVTDDVMATVWKTQEMETKPQKERMGCRLGADPKSNPTPQKPFS